MEKLNDLKMTLILHGIILFASLVIIHDLNAKFALDTDDAYITYRYADNLAHGKGFTYNPGEKVLGTTTPLYTLLLSATAMTGMDIPRASKGYNILFASLCLTLVFSFVQRLTRSFTFGLLAACLLLTYHEFLVYSISGMETGLYAMLIIATVYAYSLEWFSLAAFLAGLTFITRLDGAAVPFALGVHYLFKHRRLPHPRVLLAFAIPVLPWFIFSMAYFGHILPNSMLSKHQHPLLNGRYWMIRFLFSQRMIFLWIPLILGLLYTALRRKLDAGILVLAFWLTCYVSAYTIYRIDLYRWYYTPATVALAVLPAYGLHWLMQATLDHPTLGKLPEPFRLLVAPALAVLALAPFLYQQFREAKEIVQNNIDWTNTVEMARTDAAQYIQKHGQADDPICTGAIGLVGWITRAPLYDTMGLVTKNAVGKTVPEQLKESNAKWYITEISDDTPEFPQTVGDFNYVASFNRGIKDVTFLLYGKGAQQPATGAAATTATTAAKPTATPTATPSPTPSPTPVLTHSSFLFTNGLAIDSAKVLNDRLVINLSTSTTQAQDYKFFIHVLKPSDEATRQGIRQYDSFPTIPTSKMKPNVAYETAVVLSQTPPPEGFLILLGLFDENDPNFAKLANAAGETDMRIIWKK